jgi:rhodanese-related sulfurtransferase
LTSLTNQRRENAIGDHLGKSQSDSFSAEINQISATADPEMSLVSEIKSTLDCDQDNTMSDFSRPYCLPTITGQHPDLKSVSPNTVSQLIKGQYSHEVDTFHVIDCRYPYEFEGGHIQNAINIWQRDDILQKLIQSDRQRPSKTQKRTIIIFHCEFSSERGPKMCRLLRKMDRDAHKDCYPSLHYPELYILKGGYKDFHERHLELCFPRAYKPMLHPDHVNDVKYFRLKSKSCSGEKSSRVSRRRKLML